jgi:hypothetical protein
MRIATTDPVLYPAALSARGVTPAAAAAPVRRAEAVAHFARDDGYRVVEGEVLERRAQQAYANIRPPYRVVDGVVGSAKLDAETALSRLTGAAIIYTAHSDLNQLLGQPKGVVVDAFA